MRDYKLYISDIEEAAIKIQSYTENLHFDLFTSDSKTFESVLHNLFIIGEAANKVPEEIQEKYTDIDWIGIIGMRNVIAHGYFKIKPEIIWNTIKKDLPKLLEQIKKIK